MEKIKLKLSRQDLEVLQNATTHYANTVEQLKFQQNTAQQHIHHSLLRDFGHDLLKKYINRDPAKVHTLKMEVHTAFVCYDSLLHYSNQCNDHLEQAIIRRLIMELFAEMPTTSDSHLSLMSRLNYEE